MDPAMFGVLGALGAVLVAAGTAVVLALQNGALRGTIAALTVDVSTAKVATADEHRERDVAIARAERYLAELDDHRRRAALELANLRADLERMRDAPQIIDPVARRARWGELLAKAASVSDLLEHDPGAAGTGDGAGAELLPGVDGAPPAPDAAGGQAAGPGGGRPAS